jgi:L-fuculose-phosphate aldolase
MGPSKGRPGGDGERPKRSIGSGVGRAAASARLQAVRIALCHELVRAGRVLSRRGLVVATEGNLSARLTSERFIITRHGRRTGELTTRDFVELGVTEVDDSPARAAASLEHRVHRAGYAARPDVEAILHGHPLALTAFAIRGTPPDFSRFDEARTLVGAISFVGYVPSGSEALAEAVAHVLQGTGRPNLVLLSNHGAIATGQSVDEALARLEIAEHLAAAILAAEGTRPPTTPR